MSVVRGRVAFRLGASRILSGGAPAVVGALAVVACASHTVWMIWGLLIEHPLPFPEASELVELVVEDVAPGTPAVLLDREADLLAREAASFQSLSTWAPGVDILETAAGAEEVRYAETGPGMFDMLGVSPAGGRLFRVDDHEAAAAGERLLLLSHRLWRTTFGAAPEVVGLRIPFGGAPARILGVMPRGFQFPAPSFDLWVPAPARVPGPMRGNLRLQSVRLVGRLLPDVSGAAAAAEATTLVRNAGLPESLQRDQVTIGALGLTRQVSASFRPALEIVRVGIALLWVVGMVAACSLLASAALGGRRATSIRRALGAQDPDEAGVVGSRILLLGLAVGAAAAVLSLGIAKLARPALDQLATSSPEGPGWSGVGNLFLMAVVGVAVAECLAVAVARRVEPGLALGRSGTRRRATPAFVLVVCGTAAAAVLASGSMLLSSGALDVLRGEGSYPSRGLVHLTLDHSAPRPGVVGARSPLEVNALRDRLLLVPGVVEAGYAESLPDRPGGELLRDESLSGSEPVVVRRVGPTLFSTLQLPLVLGRGIQETDARPAEPAAVADRTLIRRLGITDPVGHVVGRGRNAYRIVGVVPDVAVYPRGPLQTAGTLYAHHSQRSHASAMRWRYVVRFRDSPGPEQLTAVRRLVEESEMGLRILRLETDQDRRVALLGAGLLTTIAVSVFGVAGLLLTLLCVLGQVANEASRQRHALAVRQALGASTGSLVREAVRRVAVAGAIGVALGAGLSWLLARFVARRMPWVEAADPMPYLLPALLITALVVVGCAVGGGILIRREQPWRILQAA